MHVRKKEITDFVGNKIIYFPNDEYRHCLHIFAAINKETISVYALNSCKKQIVGLSLSHFKTKQHRGRRANPISIYIDKELDEFLNKFEGVPRSNVLEKCLILEIDEKISRWGCKTPQQLIELMTSDTPLKSLKSFNNFKTSSSNHEEYTMQVAA